MKYREEYRDPVAARRFADAIARMVTKPWKIMEVCGGQTHSIVRYGIDQLLFRDWHSGSTPGRMGVNTAVCFVVLGLANVFAQTHANVGGIVALSAGIAVLSVSGAALLGYATGLEFSYRWGGTTRMAAHSAAAFLLLGAGVFFSGWRACLFCQIHAARRLQRRRRFCLLSGVKRSRFRWG